MTPLDPAIRDYLARSYPHNHGYRVVRGRLRPCRKLRARARALRELYPEGLRSLLDLSSCKGYFVLDAAQTPGCERALGVDVYAPDVAASLAVRDHLGLDGAHFATLTLEQLVQDLPHSGGPFQTVLLINSYHYFFFGSLRCDHATPDHERLFALARAVTGERLIFCNRIAFHRCPRHLQRRALEAGHSPADYTEEGILAAARRHFAVELRGELDHNPLLLLRPR